MSWTPERIETLKTLWAQGLTATKITENFDGVSIASVRMKLHRLGLKLSERKSSSKGINIRSRPDYYKQRSFNPKSHGKPSNPYVPERHASPPDAISFHELNSTTCRFPLGEATGLEQLFCGQKCGREDTYCKEHYTTCWIPKSSSNARRNALRDGRIRKARAILEAEKRVKA